MSSVPTSSSGNDAGDDRGRGDERPDDADRVARRRARCRRAAPGHERRQEHRPRAPPRGRRSRPGAPASGCDPSMLAGDDRRDRDRGDVPGAAERDARRRACAATACAPAQLGRRQGGRATGRGMPPTIRPWRAGVSRWPRRAGARAARAPGTAAAASVPSAAATAAASAPARTRGRRPRPAACSAATSTSRQNALTSRICSGVLARDLEQLRVGDDDGQRRARARPRRSAGCRSTGTRGRAARPRATRWSSSRSRPAPRGPGTCRRSRRWHRRRAAP